MSIAERKKNYGLLAFMIQQENGILKAITVALKKLPKEFTI